MLTVESKTHFAEELFFIGKAWGTKGRYGEALYWTCSPQTRLMEECLMRMNEKGKLDEDCEVVRVLLTCPNCFLLNQKIFNLKLTPSGELHWTKLESKQIPNLEWARKLPELIEKYSDSFNSFDNRTWTHLFLKELV